MEGVRARKGSYLCVLGEGKDGKDQVWGCVSRQNLYQGTVSISIEWLEQVNILKLSIFHNLIFKNIVKNRINI